MARPAPRGGIKAVEHVVILMQENRSFDHYFGTIPGVLGFGDRRPLRLRTGDDVFHQPRKGEPPVLPFSLERRASELRRPQSDVQNLGSTPHTYPDAVKAANRGWWDGWIEHKTETCMAHLERKDVAFQVALGNAFTLCDAAYCSMHGGTNPNRNYMWSGTTGFEPGKPGVRAVLNSGNDYDHPGYEWTTYPERLEAANISWQIYQEWDNYGDNAVEYFLPFKKVGHKILAHVTPPKGVEEFFTTEHVYDTINKLTDKGEQDRLLRELAAGRASLTADERSLFDRAMYRSEPGTIVTRFAEDVKRGRLPKVSWLVPRASLSEHPSVSSPELGARITYEFLDALASHPRTWDHTVFILLFDENDGLFDHVPSPAPPRSYSDDWYDAYPMGPGPRTPMTIVSPWSVGGRVSSEVFDITSTLMFLEKVTGVKEPNISRFRRDVVGDLTSTFDFDRGASRPGVPEAKVAAEPGKRWNPDAPDGQAMPAQGQKRRPSIPTPYGLGATGAIRGDSFTVTVSNTGSLGAAVTLYDYTNLPEEPSHHVVKGDVETKVPLKKGAYDLALRGPDRFVVDMAGTSSGAAADLGMTLVGRRDGRHVDVVVTNRSKRALDVTLTDKAYDNRRRTVRVRARGTVTAPWTLSAGWYDVAAACTQDPSWSRRFTGRISSKWSTLTA